MRNEQQNKVLTIIGKKIAAHRKKKKVSRLQLALLLNTDEKQIRRIENGEVNPTTLTLLKIRHILNMSLSFLDDLPIDDDLIGD